MSSARREGLSEFLRETIHLDFSDRVFSETLAKIVTDGMSTEQKLKRLFYFTRDSIPFVSDASLTAFGALKKMKALCYTKAMIYVSFCRRLGVPAQLAGEKFVIKADPKERLHYHGIAKIRPLEKWIYLDTVSNRDAWNHWGIKNTLPFDPPEFSLEKNVTVDAKYYVDLAFVDYETHDVPEEWLKHMQKFIDTGHW